MKHIEKALKDGATMTCFRSGGGLRVVCIDKKGKNGKDKLIAYGEHPHIENALLHAEEDLRDGFLEYKKKYDGKHHTHYLTGSMSQSSPLDGMILASTTAKITYNLDKKKFEAQFHNVYKRYEMPFEVRKQVEADHVVVCWSDNVRKISYRSSPSERGGINTSCISENNKRDPFMYKCTKTGYSKSLKKSIKEAIDATEIEVLEP